MTDTSNIKIHHCIYNGFDIIERRVWFSEEFQNTFPQNPKYIIPISIKLQDTISYEFYKKRRCTTDIEFTFGIDPDNHIEAIAVVSEKDNFNRKIGTKIVVGRIKRMRGDLKRTPYNSNPFVYKLN